jgi:hypothetical protein
MDTPFHQETAPLASLTTASAVEDASLLCPMRTAPVFFWPTAPAKSGHGSWDGPGCILLVGWVGARRQGEPALSVYFDAASWNPGNRPYAKCFGHGQPRLRVHAMWRESSVWVGHIFARTRRKGPAGLG